MSLDIDALLSLAKESSVSKWELDNITWHERASNPKVLLEFLGRIKELKKTENPTDEQRQELDILEELAEDMDNDYGIDGLDSDQIEDYVLGQPEPDENINNSNDVDGLNLIKVGAGMVAFGAGLAGFFVLVLGIY